MAEMDDEITDYEPPQIDSHIEDYKPPKTKVRPIKPQKPSKVTTLKQEFHKPLPPSIAEQAQKSQFHFETAPFRTTDLERTKLVNPNLKEIRAETPSEKMETERVRQEQRAYNILGPIGYAGLEGVRRLGRGLARPVEETFGKVLEGKTPGEPSPPEFNPSDYINRRDYEPPIIGVLPTAIDYAGQALLFRGGGGRGIEEPLPSPEIGGTPPIVPPRLGPGRTIEGTAPVEPIRPTPPQAPLRLRQGRTIVGFPPAKPPIRPTYTPPSPNDLARLSPGSFGPLGDIAISSSKSYRGLTDRANYLERQIDDLRKAGFDDTASIMEDHVNNLRQEALSLKGNEEAGVNDLTFDFLPALHEGQAPITIVPGWLIETVTGRPSTLTGGANIQISDIPSLKNKIISQAPSQAHSKEAISALDNLAQASQEEGLNTISLVNREGEGDLGLIAPHETFHAGQARVSGGSVFDLHDPEWARNHPAIQELLQRQPQIRNQISVPGLRYSTEDILAAELPTYVMGGQSNYYFNSPSEGVDFLFDYLNHIIDRHGIEAIDILEKTARVRPEIEDALPLARSMYDTYQRERAERNLQQVAGPSEFDNLGESIPATSTRGEEPRGGETGIAPTSGEAPGTLERSTRELSTEHGSIFGGIDQAGSNVSLSTTSSIKEGDLVKVIGYSNNAEVTKLLPGGGVEVKFPDGTLDEFDYDQVDKVAPKPTPKVPESNNVRQALEENPIVNVTIGESLPGIEAPIRKESDISFPPPQQLPLEGIRSELPTLGRNVVSPEVFKSITTAFTNLLKSGGIKPNPLLPPFLQVREAILDKKIDGKTFSKLLDENNLTADDFAEQFEETASVAGTLLGSLSHIERNNVKIVDLMKKDPELAKKLFPAKQRMEAILRDIETTQLGKSFLQRAGDVAQQLMLSDVRIAIRNAIVTTGRIPIIAGENMVGAWLKAMTEGKYKGNTFEQMIEAARSDAMIGLEVASEMISAFRPKDLGQVMISGQDTTRMKYSEAITQLQKSFPDLHRELVTPGFGSEKLEVGKESVDIARDTLMEMRVDVKNRDEYVKRLAVAEQRLQSNVKGIGKVLNGISYPLNIILSPTNIAEMFFRSPVFYGNLNMRLRLEGQDLASIIREGKFGEIPEEMLKDSIDQALYATHAYMPRAENGRIETFARNMIMSLNKIKITAPFTQQWFPRALYSSLKFAYEYVPLTPLIGGVPLGAIKPAMKILRPQFTEDPKTGKKIPTNPTSFKDYRRLGSALIGTILYGIAEWLRQSEYAGPEWYQVDTGKKGKTGEPLYWDIRGYFPLATFVQIADLYHRMRNKLMGDLELGKELKEALSGMSKSPETEEWVTAMGKMWGGEEDGLWEKAEVGIGRQFSFTTRPFNMLRDGYAAFSEEENKRKDLKGSGIMGPLIDNIPWLRGKYLPNAESVTGPENPKLSEYPATTFGGVRLTEGENFAGREWRRLGLLNKRFLSPDSDPTINRAQNKYFRTAVYQLGKELEKDPFYKGADNEMKAALWEMFIQGDNGIAAQSKELGLMENPQEAIKRGLIEGSGVGPLQRKAFGINKAVEEALPKK